MSGMKPEDNIRLLLTGNVFEELDQYERELEESKERRKNRVPAQGRTKTSELNERNQGYIWARRQKSLPRRSGPNDT